MQINLYYEYASIILSILLLVYYGTTQKTSNFNNKVFSMLIVSNTLTAIFDVINKILDYNGGGVDFLRLTTMGYFITHLLTLPLIFFYILTSIKNWYELSGKLKIVITLPILVAFTFLISNPFTHIIYNYDVEGNYHKGSGYIMLYLVVVFYMLFIVYLLFAFKEYYSLIERLVFICEAVIMSSSMLIQAINYNMRVETFGITYCLLMMFFVMQNPRDQIDKETGLYNRKAFFDIMHQNIATKRYFNLIEIIVSDFEEVFANDDKVTSDSVAKQMADFLSDIEESEELDGTISVYRVHDNMFCLEIEHMPEEDIISIIRKIRNRYTKPWNQNGYEILYNVKMCHIAIPEEIDSMNKLIGIVNGSVSVDDSKELLSVSDFDLGKLERQSGMNAAISKAIDEKRVDVVFSPVCKVVDKKIVSADSTIRIFDKEIGYVNADEIAQFAEKHGKIGTLCRLTVERICKFISENNPKSLGLDMIGIDLTATMCHQVGYVDYLISEVKKNNIEPSSICFKISEYTVHKAPSLVKKIMNRMHDEGFKFCLDDYGSGFTNLASIYELSFDIIKISNNVVKEAMSNEKAKITLESTIDLAKELGMTTTVGGIENEITFRLIEGSGCQYAMGEYFLENISEKELIDILVSQENMNALSGFAKSIDTNGGIA